MMMIVSGFTLDVANAYRIRALLQATADASALAAVRALPDEDAARDAALALARINMPPDEHGEVIRGPMVEIGSWRGETGRFVVGHPAADAVRVTAARGGDGGLPVPTFLVGLIGRDDWHVAASSTARARSSGSGQMTNLCPGALILSGDSIQAGGSNELREGTCVHGETGVHFGGGDRFEPGARVSAADADTIYIGHVVAGSAPREEVIAEQSLSPVITPQLPAMFDALWDTLYASSVSSYGGDLLPDFVKDPATGLARIQRVNQWWWTVQPGDLKPYTIYMVNHGMQLAGGVDAQNVAIIARGQIGVGGGPSLQFDKVFFFGSGMLNFSGDIGYGDPETWCEAGVYDAYLFSTDSISLGGWGGSSWVYGLMAAAPSIAPGGAMKSAGGLYLEADATIQLGGNIDIAGCPEALSGHYEQVVIEEGLPAVAGGTLVQ
ncbi:Putative Tad-like Flp pilus-assembly [Albimonas pacifica]|uniref:Putative Tad-like Flp pilus-assembly n=2 Tax=Albimonas pacifica TaxID=1114924 RepID=A0A1I3L2J5_9RHOB|nr:Putative Tad-like Flp pilus-assembly [Albimonas pacifica]